MTDTVTSYEPGLAAAALEALEALRRLGGRVDVQQRRSATRVLLDEMSPVHRQRFYSRPGDALDALVECGALEYESGAADGLDLGGSNVILWIQTTSPVVDAVRIAPLLDAAARFDESTSWAAIGSEPARAIARALHESPVHDDAGRAIGALALRVGSTKDAVAGVVSSMEIVGYVKCERNSRRTFDVALTDSLPRKWLDDSVAPVRGTKRKQVEPESPPAATRNDDDSGAATVAETTDSEDEPLPVVEPVDIPDESSIVVESANAHDVAFALLELVLARAAKSIEPDHRLAFLTTELSDVQHRLAAATEYGAALRRKLSEASDELVATKTERNALRQRLSSVERNLNDVMRRNGQTTTAAFRDGVQHALDGIMREIPTSR